MSDRERAYTLRLRIIYNGLSARLMHDHVTVISFTLITKLAHPNLCVLVWHWLLLSSESSSLCIMFSYRVFEPPFSLYSQRHENRISPPKHRILERWIWSIIPDLSDNVLKKKHSFLIYLVPQYLLIFILNTVWCRIAADIKVKVKRARRLQAYLKPKEKRENSNKISTSF